MKQPERDAPADILDDKMAMEPSIDDDEPTTDELVAMLRQALHEAKTGQTRPVEELLRELDEIRAENEAKG